jgi:hypothetical protein
MTKKLFVSANEWRTIEPSLLPGLSSRLNIEITPILTKSITHSLSFQDLGIQKLDKDEKYDFIRRSKTESLYTLTDKIEMQQLPINTIHSIIPYKTEDVLAFSESPVFLKRRRTYVKDTANPLTYSSWSSGSELDSIVGDILYEQQINSPHPICGEFVLQDKIPYPFEDVAFEIAVNEYSDVLVWNIFNSVVTKANTFSTGYSDNDNKEQYKDTIAKIQNICKMLEIKNCLHCVEFVKTADNKLVLMDWNLRPAFNKVSTAVKSYPILDKAIAHMMSLKYFENNSYYESLQVFSVPGGKANVKLLPNLYLRSKFTGNTHEEVKIYGIAESQTDLDNLFIKFKEINNLT